MKGQASLEQLIITSLGIGFVALMFYFLINLATDNIRTAQAKDAISKLAHTSDYIYSLGPGSKDQVEVLYFHSNPSLPKIVNALVENSCRFNYF